MVKQNSNFINRLENDIPTNIALFSHNSVWPNLQVYEDHYKNCTIDVYGEWCCIYWNSKKETS